MDTNGLKGRIAETLVEGILRRAGYEVALAGRESRVQNLLQVGSAGFMPDLLAWKPVDGARSATPRLVAIAVKYRADVEGALQREASQLSRDVEQWHDLYFTFVTDRPEPRRSCFQVVDLHQCPAGAPWSTVDLHDAGDLAIDWRTVEEYECLVKMVFPVLSGTAGADEMTRRPVNKVSGRITALRAYR